MEAYAYQAKDPELAGYCAEVKLRALRRLGQLMKDPGRQKAKGRTRNGSSQKRRGKKTPPKTAPSLDDQGVDKNLAKAARKQAAKSDEQFEKGVTDAKNVADGVAHGILAENRLTSLRKGKTEGQTEGFYRCWYKSFVALEIWRRCSAPVTRALGAWPLHRSLRALANPARFQLGSATPPGARPVAPPA